MQVTATRIDLIVKDGPTVLAHVKGRVMRDISVEDTYAAVSIEQGLEKLTGHRYHLSTADESEVLRLQLLEHGVMPTKERDVSILDAMTRYGGGFVKKLAAAAAAADGDNYRRLRLAFPELWVEYSDRRLQSADPRD